jgi:hypothetical protein
MLRLSPTLLGGKILYHRKAMALSKRVNWRGNYGATGKWIGKIAMSEEVTNRRSITEIDREMMGYVHANRTRHDQMARSYHEIGKSKQRSRMQNREFYMRRLRYMQTAYKAYFQYETFRTLQQQAKLVTQYGQAAVNRALGDRAVKREDRGKRAAAVRRMVRAVPMQSPVPNNIVTRFQHYPDRFNRKYRLN